MGYQLPIQPIQSQMYASRMENASPKFAYIDRVQAVKMQTDYDEWQKIQRREERINEQADRDAVETVSTPPSMPLAKKGFIQPNPVSLSKEVAIVVGKGIAVNEYA